METIPQPQLVRYLTEGFASEDHVPNWEEQAKSTEIWHRSLYVLYTPILKLIENILEFRTFLTWLSKLTATLECRFENYMATVWQLYGNYMFSDSMMRKKEATWYSKPAATVERWFGDWQTSPFDLSTLLPCLEKFGPLRFFPHLLRFHQIFSILP